MKKYLFLLLASLLLMLVSPAPVAAQHFRRLGHANNSQTLKAEHSRKNVRQRDKAKPKRSNPKHDERHRRREAKRQQKRRADGPPRPRQPRSRAGKDRAIE